MYRTVSANTSYGKRGVPLEVLGVVDVVVGKDLEARLVGIDVELQALKDCSHPVRHIVFPKMTVLGGLLVEHVDDVVGRAPVPTRPVVIQHSEEGLRATVEVVGDVVITWPNVHAAVEVLIQTSKPLLVVA